MPTVASGSQSPPLLRLARGRFAGGRAGGRLVGYFSQRNLRPGSSGGTPQAQSPRGVPHGRPQTRGQRGTDALSQAARYRRLPRAGSTRPGKPRPGGWRGPWRRGHPVIGGRGQPLTPDTLCIARGAFLGPAESRRSCSCQIRSARAVGPSSAFNRPSVNVGGPEFGAVRVLADAEGRTVVTHAHRLLCLRRSGADSRGHHRPRESCSIRR